MPDDEDARLDALRQYDILDTEPEENFDEITRLAAFICDTPTASVTLIDRDRQWFKSVHGRDAQETPREIAFCAQTILQRELLVVPDAMEDARFASNPFVRGEPCIRFYAGAPLVTMGGHALGALCVTDSVPRTLSPAQGEALRTLARQISHLLELRRLVAERGRAEERHRQSEAALSASEARKAAVLEAALDSIITADGDGLILEFNPAAESTFGYTRAEVLGRPIAEVIIPPSLRAAHTPGLDHFRAMGEGPILRRRIEVVGVRKDGAEFPLEIAIVPMAGGGVEFTAYLRNISDRKQQEDERERLLQEVEANTLIQRAFLRDVLASVTDGRLILCDTPEDLPKPLSPVGEAIALTYHGGLGELRHLSQDTAVGMVEECVLDLVIAVGEAAMNAVVHGGGSGKGWVFVGGDGTVQVRIEDRGTGIALASLPKATLARGYSTKASLGHGFKMMQQIDRVYVLTGPTGTTIVLEQGREPMAPPWF